MKQCKPIEEHNGEMVFDLDSTEEGSDWMKLGRLKARAMTGDIKARREIARMENSPLFVED